MIEVARSTTHSRAARRVWALIRDFNAMPQWNATIRSSVIEAGPADRIGCRRVLAFDDGSVWTHELTLLSDAEMTFRLCDRRNGARDCNTGAQLSRPHPT
jgi:hypothetical protein